MKLKKVLRFLGYTLLIVFLLANTSAAFHAWRLTHFYDVEGDFRKPYRMSAGEKAQALAFGVKIPKPAVTGRLTMKHDTVKLKTNDGLVIDAWYARAKNAKGTVALFHGHLANKGAVLPEAMAFYNMGYNILLVDFRGHGNSEGDYCTIGYKEGEEVKLAIDYIKAKGEKKIIVWGISMGAAAITSAFQNHNIKPDAAILELPFGSLHQAVESRVKLMKIPVEPLSSMLTFWGGVENGFNAFDFSPANYAKTIGCPVLLQAGKQDGRVSLVEIDAIFSNISSTEKQKVVYANAGHQSLLNKERDKWLKVTGAFLKRLD